MAFADRSRGQPAAPVRVGVIGFGRLAQRYYAPAFRRLTSGRIVAVADPLAASRAAAQKLYPGITAHADHRALLETAELDAVLVASPPSSHLEVWRDAAAQGLPVFMEKPLVVDAQLQLPALSAAAKRLLMVDFNRRFWPTYRKIAELVRAGRIGTPQAAEFVLRTNVLSWNSVTAHRLSPSEGGVLCDLGSQVLDLVSLIFGDQLATIAAAATTKRWEADHVRLELAFASGLPVGCDVAYAQQNAERLVIRGAEGVLRLRDPNMSIQLERGRSRPGRLAGLGRDAVVLGYRALRRDRSMLRYSIHAALEAFLRALQTGQAFTPGYADAVRNLDWLQAARRSIAAGSPVAVATPPVAQVR